MGGHITLKRISPLSEGAAPAARLPVYLVEGVPQIHPAQGLLRQSVWKGLHLVDSRRPD